MIRLRLLAVLLVSACTASAAVYQTRTEQAGGLAINGAPQTIFTQCVAVSPGMTLLVFLQTEVTNPTTYNVMVADTVQLNGSNVIPPSDTNVTPAQHHYTINKSFADFVPSTSTETDRCYTLVLWAASDWGSDQIIIEPGYGFLQVVPK